MEKMTLCWQVICDWRWRCWSGRHDLTPQDSLVLRLSLSSLASGYMVEGQVDLDLASTFIRKMRILTLYYCCPTSENSISSSLQDRAAWMYKKLVQSKNGRIWFKLEFQSLKFRIRVHVFHQIGRKASRKRAIRWDGDIQQKKDKVN